MSDDVSQSYPEHAALRQHFAWLEQFIGGMTDANWKDMRLHAERQLEKLSGYLAQRQNDCGALKDEMLAFFLAFFESWESGTKLTLTDMAALDRARARVAALSFPSTGQNTPPAGGSNV